MGSFDTTYWLAAAHIILVLISFILTLRPLVSVYHWALLVSFMAFGLRPALAASVGGHTNYDSGVGWYAYNEGLLCQLIFMFCFSAVYILMYSFNRSQPVKPLERVPGAKGFYLLFVIGLMGLFILQVGSGGAWLPGVRSGTINTVVPGGKYIFPFAVMAFSLLIPYGVIGYVNKSGIKLWLVIAAVLVSLTGLSLLFMRGMVITGIFLILWALEKGGKVKAKHIIIGLLAMFMIGQLLRPLGKYVATRYLMNDCDATVTVAAAVVEKMSPLQKIQGVFLFTTNMDLADSWPVVINYVEERGFLNGCSFLAIPARFASTKFRLSSGYLTGSDIVNEFFYGANYEKLSFGFNVTFANELFLNFGCLGLVLGVLPGMMTWAADRWLRRTRALSTTSLFIAYICFRGFINELAIVIQWAVGALLLAFVVETFVRLRFTRPKEHKPIQGLDSVDNT